MKRPLFLCSILFIIGSFLGVSVNTRYLIFIPLISFLAVVVKLLISPKQSYPIFLYVCIMIIVLYAGFARGFIVRKNGIGDLYAYFNKSVVLGGEVVYISPSNNYFDVKGKWIKSDNDKSDINVKVRVRTALGITVNIKDFVVIDGPLYKFSEMRFWGDYDLRTSHASYGVFGKIFASGIKVVGNYAGKLDLIKFGHNVRTALSEKIDSLIEGEEGQLLKGILIGDISQLSDETKENLNLSGLSHIAALSGINISIFLSVFSLFICSSNKKRFKTAIFTIFAVVVYVAIVGGQPSVLRAAAMVVYATIVTNLRLRNDSISSLFISTMVLIFINPYLTYNVSFQLSFLSTLGILLFAPYFKRNIFGVTFAVMLFIAPVTAYYFNVITLAAFFTNILTSPFIFFTLVIGYAIYFAPWLAGLLKLNMSI